MTFNEAEEFWRETLDEIDTEENEDGTARIMVSINMVETALKAFEAVKSYRVDCKNLREELSREQSHNNLISSVINYADDSGAERAEATFNVDDFKVTIIAERKGE